MSKTKKNTETVKAATAASNPAPKLDELDAKERAFVEGLRAHPDRTEAITRLLLAKRSGDYAAMIIAVLDAPDGTLELLQEGLEILREKGSFSDLAKAIMQG